MTKYQKVLWCHVSKVQSIKYRVQATLERKNFVFDVWTSSGGKVRKKENERSIVAGVTITILKFIKNDTQAHLQRLLKHLRRVRRTWYGSVGNRGSERKWGRVDERKSSSRVGRAWEKSLGGDEQRERFKYGAELLWNAVVTRLLYTSKTFILVFVPWRPFHSLSRICICVLCTLSFHSKASITYIYDSDWPLRIVKTNSQRQYIHKQEEL